MKNITLPILCSNDKRGRLSKRLHKSVKSDDSKPIDVTFPLTGDVNGNAVFVTDKTVNVVKRSNDFYYKWIFSYKSSVADHKLTLSEVTIDEDKSKFLFSARKGLEGCTVEANQEYSYKELKDKCTEDSIINTRINKMASLTTISCTEEMDSGISYRECEGKMGEDEIELEGELTLEEINYKLDNMKVGTYSPSKEFYGKTSYDSIKVKDNTVMKAEYDFYRFDATYRNVTIEEKGNYTKVTYKKEKNQKFSMVYFCLESECKYICETSSSNYEDNSEWYFYQYQCYGKGSDFEKDFNDGFKKANDFMKNFNPSKMNLRRSLLEEPNNNNKHKSSKAVKGYYNEKVEDGYIGYFVSGDKLTIIKQSEDYPTHVQQLKLVLTLDPETRSAHIGDDIFAEGDIDQVASGIEPSYDQTSDAACKSFIPFNRVKDAAYTKCDLEFGNIVEKFTYKDYNISVVDSKTVLKIHDTEESSDDKVITLNEYEDSTKLDEIVNKISKITKPISNNKCFRYNYTEEDEEYVSVLYNNHFYKRNYEVDTEIEKIEVEIRFLPKDQNEVDYTRDDDYVYTEIDENHYYGADENLNHKYVDFKPYSYVECSEEVKTSAFREVEARIQEVRKAFGISDGGSAGDGSVEYMMNIFLLALLFIIII